MQAAMVHRSHRAVQLQDRGHQLSAGTRAQPVSSPCRAIVCLGLHLGHCPSHMCSALRVLVVSCFVLRLICLRRFSVVTCAAVRQLLRRRQSSRRIAIEDSNFNNSPKRASTSHQLHRRGSRATSPKSPASDAAQTTLTYLLQRSPSNRGAPTSRSMPTGRSRKHDKWTHLPAKYKDNSFVHFSRRSRRDWVRGFVWRCACNGAARSGSPHRCGLH